MAVDGSGSATTYDGTSWSLPSTVAGQEYFGSVSCVSSTFCVATGTTQVSVYDGSSWTSQTVVSSGLGGVSCATETMCVAFGFDGDVVRGL